MMRQDDFHLLGIAGSLRSGSFNRGLLRAAGELLPEGVTYDIFPLDEIPLYNADLQAQGDPAPVKALKEAIEAADGLLIATPENNYSIPGVLKNALDWASRPNKSSCLKGKPVGIIGASSGESGTIRAQLALRQVFVLTNSLCLVQPELRVPFAGQKFDPEGVLVDEDIRRRLQAYIQALVDWGRLVGRR